MPSQLNTKIDPTLILILAIGSAACLFQLGMADLDIDEAYTALAAGGNFGTILTSVKAASTPPLFFYLLRGWQELFGSNPVALRLLSVLMGLLSLTAIYYLTRSMLGTSAARWSAVFMVVSPLWLFRARDVRMYALAALLVILAIGILYRALYRNRPLDWILVALVLVAGCYTHSVFIFVTPIALLPFVIRRLKDRRLPSLLSFALAVALWLPWLPLILEQSRTPALDWIAPFWDALPPVLALPKSLLAFLPGTVYPVIMRPMPQQTGFWILIPIVAAALAFVYALRPMPEDRTSGAGKVLQTEIRFLLITFLLIPLMLMWGYSRIVRPIYLAGGYDIIALPAFCVLAGWGVSRWVNRAGRSGSRHRAFIAAGVLGVLWVTTLAPYYHGLRNPFFRHDSLSATFLKDRMQAGDALVYLGLRRSQLEYSLQRLGVVTAYQVSFPSELDRHPAWISVDDMLTRIDKLREEGRALSRALFQYAGKRHRIWVVGAGDNPINRTLMELLSRLFDIDNSKSSMALGIYCLTPVEASEE